MPHRKSNIRCSLAYAIFRCGLLATFGVQLGSAPYGTPTIRSWTTAHGLPQNWVECLLQTRDGYWWIGTRGSLARFDGVRFTVFDQAATGLPQMQVSKSLAEDRDGNLWIRTFVGGFLRGVI
ncbi:MAG: hypothetical protein FJ403_12080 [Verrucomicrobia bacterium]|nr:hypothetical protein [Verrucomicrobiota bacterium]